MNWAYAAPSPDMDLNSPFNIGIGQTANVKDADLSLRFVNVTEESRCPSDVVCIWEGQISILIDLTQATDGRNLGHYILTIRGSNGQGGGDDLSTKIVYGYLIRLVDVQPYPADTGGISPSDYSATLVVSKADEMPNISRGVLIGALGYRDERDESRTSSNSTTIAKLIAGWSIERGKGAAVLVLREDDDGSLKRVVLRFTPSQADTCVHRSNVVECVDWQLTYASVGDARFYVGSSIHVEIDDSKTKLFITPASLENDVGTGDNSDMRKIGEEQVLNLTKYKVFLRSFLPIGNASIVTLKEGQREGPLLVQKIHSDNVEGLNFPEYPLAREEGLPITLHIGERASNGCTIMLTLIKIENASAVFEKVVDENRPCPICWYQEALLSGRNY
jgi:hypothetical protein